MNENIDKYDIKKELNKYYDKYIALVTRKSELDNMLIIKEYNDIISQIETVYDTYKKLEKMTKQRNELEEPVLKRKKKFFNK